MTICLHDANPFLRSKTLNGEIFLGPNRILIITFFMTLWA